MRCETCASIHELREEQHIDLLLHPLHKSKKCKQPAAPAPVDQIADQIAAPTDNQDVFKLQLEMPICDNTTKFSKFIHKRLSHLSGKIGQYSSHLTGIAWQKKFEEYSS